MWLIGWKKQKITCDQKKTKNVFSRKIVDWPNLNLSPKVGCEIKKNGWKLTLKKPR